MGAPGRLERLSSAVATLPRAVLDAPAETPVGVRRGAFADEAALVDALHVAYAFDVINRVAHALAFEHRSDRDRRRGARILLRNGYRLPPWLMR